MVDVDGENAGRIKVVDFARPEMLRRGRRGTLSAPPEAAIRDVAHPRLLQGAYEGSNVQATRELIGLIEAQRSYERKNRAIKMINEASSALVRAAQGL
jgi:flagellar basal body rod protein FlgG